MLYCCITIDYLSQLERSGVREAAAFADELRALALNHGATVASRKNPILITFPSGGMFDGIQTAEALLRMTEAFAAYEARLRGASLVVHEADSADEALAFASAARYRDCSEYLYVRSPQASARLAAYFRPDAGVLAPPTHSVILGDADAASLFERPRLAATLARTVAKAERNGPRLVHLEAGPGARSSAILVRAAGMREDRTLIVDGTRSRRLSFSPLLEAIAARQQAIPGDNKKSAFDYIASSSFSGGAPETVSRGCAAWLDAWLDAFGDAGGTVICDNPALFSIETQELVARRLAEGRGLERYITIASTSLPELWSGPWAARVSASIADTDDRPEMLEKALGTTGGMVRKALSRRFGSISPGSGRDADSGLEETLGLLPVEASLYLHALISAENELSAPEISGFMAGLGLKPKGEVLLKTLLSRAGLLDPVIPGMTVAPLNARLVARMAGQETAAIIDGRLSDYLISLYRSGRIRPSLGFLERVGERQAEERLLYDCLFAETTRPDSGRPAEPAFLSASSASVYRFWSALTARDRDASEAAASVTDTQIAGPRAQTVRALARAELAYANGDPERAAKAAREAMLALGKGAAPKLEARCQRMMGLAALALDRQTEAVDYLTNAQELSETAGDDYERMMAAYTKGLVEFLTGALVKSLKALDCAEESAQRMFRMDALAAIEALRGRIDIEMGSYDEAARRFLALGELAATYALPAAERRAGIWRARALAYAGEFDQAAAMLEAEAEDPEARAFRGELELLRGRPRDARTWLEAAPAPVPRPFDPPDSFDWTSLFSEIEGRSIHFSLANAPLAEFRTAHALFARGLDERNPDCAVELHAMTRSERASRNDPGIGTYSFFCYLLEELLPEPPIDRQTVLSRAFKILQQRAGRIEDRARRALYMEKNAWNRRLIEAARTHKFI